MAAILFTDRIDAGNQLANKLTSYLERDDAMVLALPRGGVPVGFAVASRLRLSLDIMIVRKLGLPGHEEYAMGAVASGGLRVMNPQVLEMMRVDERTVESVVQRELQEMERREQTYRNGQPQPELEQKDVLLVDDGLATGSTMLAAVAALRQKKPARVIVAVPVGAADTCARVGREVDDIICLHTPEPFHAVSPWYADFSQITDEEVRELLHRAKQLAR